MVELLPIFKKTYWTLAALGGVYAAFLLCLTNPTIQKQYVQSGIPTQEIHPNGISALYAHKAHTGYWDDLDHPEKIGFASRYYVFLESHRHQLVCFVPEIRALRANPSTRF